MNFHKLWFDFLHVFKVCHVSCRVVSCHVVSCRVVSCHVMSCHVMSCHVMSCHVMSCHVMSCHVMSCEPPEQGINFKLAHPSKLSWPGWPSVGISRAMRESIPFSLVLDLGVDLLRWSTTPTISSQ